MSIKTEVALAQVKQLNDVVVAIAQKLGVQEDDGKINIDKLLEELDNCVKKSV